MSFSAPHHMGFYCYRGKMGSDQVSHWIPSSQKLAILGPGPLMEIWTSYCSRTCSNLTSTRELMFVYWSWIFLSSSFQNMLLLLKIWKSNVLDDQYFFYFPNPIILIICPLLFLWPLPSDVLSWPRRIYLNRSLVISLNPIIIQGFTWILGRYS